MAGSLMLDHLGEKEAADMIEKAVMKAVKDDLDSVEAKKMGMSTSQVGDTIAQYISGA